jgi:hypothetical protein
MLNVPAPGFAGTAEEYEHGVRALTSMGCVQCHVPDWDIAPKDGIHAGDRRAFDFVTSWNTAKQRLEGRLVALTTLNGANHERNFAGYSVKGFFSDLKHHEMGEQYREIDFGGTLNTLWRTPALWGVGSGFPWGHDGRSLTLEDAVLRHGGEAAAARAAWVAAPDRTREHALNLMRKLVLYDIETLPADIDGDGVISDHFVVAGKDTGIERFNAEWLFKTPLAIQGPVANHDGITVVSNCGMNIDQAYGRTLALRKDSDGDGWPDVWDHAPNAPGVKDGVNN